VFWNRSALGLTDHLCHAAFPKQGYRRLRHRKLLLFAPRLHLNHMQFSGRFPLASRFLPGKRRGPIELSCIRSRTFPLRYQLCLTSFLLDCCTYYFNRGDMVSLPDASLNILQENPTVPWGCNSLSSINTEGDPDRPRAIAFSSSIL
jgi:hypothetical protein